MCKKSHLLYYGTTRPNPVRPKGRPLKITVAAEERMKEYILECDQSPTSDELQELLLNEFDIEVNSSTIRRRLKNMGISWKRGKRRHPNRNEESRQAWVSKGEQYKASQVKAVSTA